MADHDTIIVGAGLMGSIVGGWLRRQGQSVLILDAEKPLSGSAAAACVMKPSWLSKLSKKEMAQSFAILDELYGLHELEARVTVAGITKTVGVYWVAPRGILKVGRFEPAEVVEVHHGESPWVRCSDGRVIHGRTIIVAAGHWSSKLCEVNNLTAQAGVAFTWKTMDLEDGRVSIAPWAPYKQLLAIKLEPGKLWVGDGTALKQESLTERRIQESLKRCSHYVQMEPNEAQRIVGMRPYIRGLKEPAFVKEVAQNVWAATAISKNGTAGAGWAAYRLAQALQ